MAGPVGASSYSNKSQTLPNVIKLLLVSVALPVLGKEKNAAVTAANEMNLKFGACVTNHRLPTFLAEKFCGLECDIGALIIDTESKKPSMDSNSYFAYMEGFVNKLNIDPSLKYFTFYPTDSLPVSQRIVVADPNRLVDSQLRKIAYENFQDRVTSTCVLKFHESVEKSPLTAYKELIDGFIIVGINTGIEPLDALTYALKQAVTQRLKYSHDIDITSVIDDAQRESIAKHVGIASAPGQFFVQLAQTIGKQIFREPRECGVLQYVSYQDAGIHPTLAGPTAKKIFDEELGHPGARSEL